MKVYYEIPCSNMRAFTFEDDNARDGYYVRLREGNHEEKFDAVFCSNCNRGVAAGMHRNAKVTINEREGRTTVAPVGFQWRFCPYCGVEFDYPRGMFMPECCVSEPGGAKNA